MSRKTELKQPEQLEFDFYKKKKSCTGWTGTISYCRYDQNLHWDSKLLAQILYEKNWTVWEDVTGLPGKEKASEGWTEGHKFYQYIAHHGEASSSKEAKEQADKKLRELGYDV